MSLILGFSVLLTAHLPHMASPRGLHAYVSNLLIFLSLNHCIRGRLEQPPLHPLPSLMCKIDCEGLLNNVTAQ